MIEHELAGRRAIVTGSAKNIGRAIAIELAQAGAAVAINARTSDDAARDVAAEIERAGGRAVVVLADVGTADGARRLIDDTAAALGGIDILVNNAAVRREAAFADLDFAQWREVLSIALDGAYLCSHAALPHLMRAPAGHAAIVNIGGLTAHTGAARRAHVVAAKAGLVGLTRALAHDLAPHVTVNCVAPGLIETARAGAAPAHHAHAQTLLGRRGQPADVAALVRFVCGPGGRYLTGQTLHVNGGAYLG
ncbi:MAG: SDR family NAD(P)-dependent oxidoreductase [Vicinamibacterales bacterium]